MLPVINLGPLALPTPQLLLLLGFWIGLELTEKHAPRYRAQANELYNLVLLTLVAGLLGARLAYAARAPQAFLESPLNLLSPRVEMLEPIGGWIAALIVALLYMRRRRLPLWPTLDALTTLFAVMAITLGLAHFASGDAFGAPTQAPWAIELWGEKRHPTQVYETLAALAIAAATWPGGRAAQVSERGESPGFRFWVFLGLMAATRLLLESFRGDSLLVLNLFRQAQVIAWGVLALSLWQIGKRIKQTSEVSWG